MKAIKNIKILNILTVLAMVCSFFSQPVIAATDNEEVLLTQLEGVSVTASEQNSRAVGLIDGDTTVADSATSEKKGAWAYYSEKEQCATIDLGALTYVSHIEVYAGYGNGNEKPESFKILYSNDGNVYCELAQASEGYSNDPYDITLERSIEARYIKVLIPSAESARAVRIRELCVYGSVLSSDTVQLTALEGVSVTASVQNGLATGLIDGDTTVADGATSDKKGAWTYYGKNEQYATIDLGVLRYVSHIEVYAGYGNGTDKPETFKILYSMDGKVYRELAQASEGYSNDPYDITLERSVEARYIKVLIPSAASERTVRIRELCVYGSALSRDTVQLAALEGVSVTASVQNGLATGLIDGDTTVADGATSDKKGAWTYFSEKEQYATIDLGALKSVSQVKVYAGYASGTNKPESFKILYSPDGTSYHELVQVLEGYNGDPYDIELTKNIGARYIKILIPKAESARAVRVREIQVYGSDIELDNVNIFTYADCAVSCTPADDSVAGLTDGNCDNASSYSNGGGAWVYVGKDKRTVNVNLGNNYYVGKIKIYLGYKNNNDSTANNRPEGIKISYSIDMQKYTEVLNVSSDVSEEYEIPIFDFVRVVRVEIPAAEQSRVVRVRELEVYGRIPTESEIGGDAKIMCANDLCVVNHGENVLSVDLLNTDNREKDYKVEYSADGVTAVLCANGTVGANESKTIPIKIDSLLNGKYPDFNAAVYMDGILFSEFKTPITVVEEVTDKPLSEYSRIGVNWHADYNTSNKDKVDVEKYNKLMQKAGIEKTRSIHRWAWLETVKGQRPFSKHDEVDGYMVKYGQIYSPYILGFVNELYFPEEPRSYEDVMNEIEYSTQVVENLSQKGVKIDSLEIWNEPNLESFWRSNRKLTYFQFANRIGFEMKRLYPDKQIIGAVVANTGYLRGENFLDDYFEHGALMYTDEFSLHPYVFTTESYLYNWDSYYYSKITSLLKSRENAGGWINVSATEAGYPTHNTGVGVSDEVQAAILPKYAICNDEMDLALTDFYTFEDTGSDPADPENNFGLVQYDFIPKDSYVSVTKLINLLKNSEYVGRFNADGTNSGNYIYVYTTPDEIFGVTWCTKKEGTFSLALDSGVVAEDLYGNIISATNGSVAVDYKPMYLRNLPESYLYKASAAQAENIVAEIKSAYPSSPLTDNSELDKITTAFNNANNSSTLKSAIDTVYAYGDALMSVYRQNKDSVELKDLSVILSYLNRMAKRGLMAYSSFNIAGESSGSSLNEALEVITAKKGAEQDSALLYTDAIMRFSKRYNEKANEIKQNYPSLIGIACAYDTMAKRTLAWVMNMCEFEEPDISRAVFTYAGDTNPEISKGIKEEYTIEIENKLTAHTINGTLHLTDESGKKLSSSVDCIVNPGECKTFTINAIVPDNATDGETTLYIELVENGKVLKKTEICANVSDTLSSKDIAVYGLELYDSDGNIADKSDICKGSVLTAKAIIKRQNDISIPNGANLILAQYNGNQLVDVKLLAISEEFNSSNTSANIELATEIKEGTDKIGLFVIDFDTVWPFSDAVMLER